MEYPPPTTLFLADPERFHFKDDVTVILLLGVSFMSVSTEEWKYSMFRRLLDWVAEWQREHENMNEYNTYNKHTHFIETIVTIYNIIYIYLRR